MTVVTDTGIVPGIFDNIPLCSDSISNVSIVSCIFFPFPFHFQSKEDQIQVIGNLKNISMASSKLLLAAKSLSVDPGAANAKNLLAVAARCEDVDNTCRDLNCSAFSLCLSLILMRICSKSQPVCPKHESCSLLEPVRAKRRPNSSLKCHKTLLNANLNSFPEAVSVRHS